MSVDERIVKGVSRYKVPNLERALLVMEYLLDHPGGAGVTEITEALGFSKNSVFRITMTLLEHSYLLRNEDTKRFSLSRKLLAMGTSALTETHIMEHALDIMRELRDKVQETVLIGTIIGHEGVVLDQVLGSHPFKFALDVGLRLELHVAAPGKAILAFLPDSEQKTILDKMSFKKFNDNTITTVGAFKKELKEVHEKGYAIDCAEELHGVHCIGAPIFDRHGYPVASIWTTGPADRLPAEDFEKVGALIADRAVRISARLGYRILNV